MMPGRTHSAGPHCPPPYTYLEQLLQLGPLLRHSLPLLLLPGLDLWQDLQCSTGQQQAAAAAGGSRRDNTLTEARRQAGG